MANSSDKQASATPEAHVDRVLLGEERGAKESAVNELQALATLASAAGHQIANGEGCPPPSSILSYAADAAMAMAKVRVVWAKQEGVQLERSVIS